MVFSDTLFLFLFLPLLLVLHALVPRRFRNHLLLVASLAFYAFGEGAFVFIMLVSIAVNYGIGLVLERSQGAARKRVLALGIALNIAGIVAFKYANFLVDNLSAIAVSLGGSPIELAHVHLPIGISFFTFECISYLMDVSRREVNAEKSPINLALFVALFPHLVAGPILRYADLAAQIRSRDVDLVRFTRGAERFSIGLAKKMLIANPAGLKADLIFALPAAELSTPVAWLGLACYTVQIYFDFSGYSDMAIGLGRLFGFELCENFNYPYVARSITDFWRRWHMSLSTWFRDYLYIPLGGNRKGPARTYLNLVTVFFLCGLWHGASWNFLIWGVLHGAFLVIERGPVGRILERLPAPLAHAYTLLAVMLAWVFFRATTLTESVTYLSALSGFTHTVANAQPLSFFMDGELWLVLACAAIGATPLPKQWVLEGIRVLPQWAAIPVQALGLFVLFVASAAHVAAGSYSPFIYLRF